MYLVSHIRRAEALKIHRRLLGVGRAHKNPGGAQLVGHHHQMKEPVVVKAIRSRGAEFKRASFIRADVEWKLVAMIQRPGSERQAELLMLLMQLMR